MRRRRLALFAISLAFVSVLTGCGSDEPSATSPTTSSSTPSASFSKTNAFVLDEWSVVPPNGDLAAGKIALTVTNKGSETHELVIVRASDAASLPKKSDGSVDEDKIPESKKAGEIADLAAGKSKTKTFDLAAGDYIAFCNIVETMGKDGMGSNGSGGMGGGSMHGGSGMGTGSGSGGGGMDHVHFELGMVNYFTVV